MIRGRINEYDIMKYCPSSKDKNMQLITGYKIINNNT